MTIQIRENKHPFPPAKHLVPTIVAMWNGFKGGIDVYSRLLKNVQSDHKKLGPKCFVIFRLIKSLLLNAHISKRLFEVCTICSI